MSGASDALQGHGDGARRADLADEIDVADIDAEFERGGGDEDAALALLEAALGLEAEMARERAVVGGDVLFAHALGEAVGDALDEAAGVDEDESGAMLLSELAEAVVDFVPHFVGGDGAEFAGGQFDGEVEVAEGDFDDDRRGALAADEEFGDEFDGRLVAERPMRTGGCWVMASRRSSERARWAPRLLSATAWISSTMTVWTWRRVSRLRAAVSRM